LFFYYLAARSLDSKQCRSTPARLCKTRYNTTAPMYGVSLTSGQPVTIGIYYTKDLEFLNFIIFFFFFSSKISWFIATGCVWSMRVSIESKIMFLFLRKQNNNTTIIWRDPWKDPLKGLNNTVLFGLFFLQDRIGTMS
jgi:hypothetical protein